MKFAFEIKTLVMVEAESEDEAWDLLPATAREAMRLAEGKLPFKTKFTVRRDYVD